MPRIVTFGEIMARLATPGYLRFQQALPGALDVTFAGAEASVAASVAYLGGQATFITALPKNPLADACVADLRSLGVDTQSILRTDAGRLGLYFLEKGVNQRPGNVIYDRADSAVAITPPTAYDWPALLADASWLLISGITPAISRTAAEVTTCALEAAKALQVPVAFDMNFRSKLWRWDDSLSPQALAARTVRELMPLVTLFIGGVEDAAAMLDIHPRDRQQPQLDIARQIRAQYPEMEFVAMTQRENISATHNNLGGFFYDAAADAAYDAPHSASGHEPYVITDIVDRLGGGDAFTAGLLFALTTPELAAPQSAIAFATAAACLAHSIEGDYNYSTREEVEALVSGNAPGRVRR